MARKTTRSKSGKAPTKKRSTRSTSASSKKKTKKKIAARSTKKKTSKSRKKVGSKKKTTRKKTLSKKKTTRKKSTAKKTTKKKTSSKKKTSAKKTSSKKKTTRKKAGTPEAADEKKAPAKKTKKKSTSKKTSRRKKEESIQDLTPDKDGYVIFKGRRVRMISTKNVTPKKKRPRTAATSSTDITQTDGKLVKTKLTKKELDKYRGLLLIERAERMGDLSAMEAEALRSSGGNLSTMPIHMADIGTDVYDQDFMLGMAESERRLIREIDEALQRIEDKTYGVCQMTGKPIPKTRLNAKPWAKYTIEAARMVENGQVG